MITSLPGIGFRLEAIFVAAHGEPTLVGPDDRLTAWAGRHRCRKFPADAPGECTPRRYSRFLGRLMYMSVLPAARCDSESKGLIWLGRGRTTVLYVLTRETRNLAIGCAGHRGCGSTGH